MPYPSVELLAAAAEDLRERDPLAVVTIPALLRGARRTGAAPTDLQEFGSPQENEILGEAFGVADGATPYLAIWGKKPQLVRFDYSGSSLQAKRTRDAFGQLLFASQIDPTGRKKTRTHFALKPDAGAAFMGKRRELSKVSLAAWLGRKEQFSTLQELMEWFDHEFPLAGTDLDLVYSSEIPETIEGVPVPFAPEPATDEEILSRLGVELPDNPVLEPVQVDPVAVREENEDSLEWTRDFCEYPLSDANPKLITSAVLQDLASRNIELPDAERLVRRCVTALLVGNLILQGPPGTGKTTLARALARGFRIHLMETTATSEWSPFHVVGGLRPNASGGLAPAYGGVAEAALACARIVRKDVSGDLESVEQEGALTQDALFGAAEMHFQPSLESQAVWLFIDEFNRADIDKAIGSLYTMLSSCNPSHLRETPIDLWYETEEARKKLWVPARFRIIGAMNDLDTSFVNQISQGLTRRFQFIYVGVPEVSGTEQDPISSELGNAFMGAYEWLTETYKLVLAIPPANALRNELSEELQKLQAIIDRLRRPISGSGWPVGTAQIVDVLKTVLIQVTAGYSDERTEALDFAIADLLVPQMGFMDDIQYEAFAALFNESQLVASAAKLRHLFNPHSLD